jgi:hypothetical protein
MRSVAWILALAVAAGFGCDSKSDPKISAPKKTDLGTGFNTVEKTYPRSPTELIDTVTATLRSFELTVESDRHDDLGGEIVARRADGSKVTARVTARTQSETEVSIRVAPGNKNLAELIHERLHEKVEGLPAK